MQIDLEWLSAHKSEVASVVFCILRLMESVAIVSSNKKGTTIMSILKEFFRFG